MRIIKFILHRYNRLVLSGIVTVEYTPKKGIQIIAGTNGSGKSSFISELSPLPANIKKDFSEDGWKYLEFEHNGKMYVVESGGSLGATKHSFKENGSELNPGGTKKVQLILCKDILNITPLIHEVLTNQKPITSMSIGERKVWLSYISTVDYKYALNVFKKVVTEHRDLIGAVKMLDTKITSVISAKKSKDDIRLLEVELELLNISISNYTKLIDRNINNRQEFNRLVLENSTNELEVILSRLNKLKNSGSISQSEYYEYKEELAKLKYRIDQILSKINKYNEADEEAYESLLNRRKTLLEEYDKYKLLSKELNINISDIYLKREKFIDKFHYLRDILSNLRSYEEYSCNVDVNKVKQHSIFIENELKKIENETSFLKEEYLKLHAFRNEKDTVCPSCSHNWKQNFNRDRYNNLESKISHFNTKVDTFKKELKKNEDKLEVYFTCKELKDTVYNILKEENINILFNFSFNLPKDTSLLLHKVEDRYNELKSLRNPLVIESEIESVSKQISYVNSIKSESSLDRDKLEKEIDELYKRKSIVESKVSHYDNQILVIKRLKRQYENHIDILKSSIKVFKNNKVFSLNQICVNEIKKLEEEKLSIEKMLYDARYADSLISELEEDKKKLLLRISRLAILIKSLSPNEGLIAKSMLSFLGVFVENINNIINNIWSYNMSLNIPDIDENNDLDYKFKVIVEDNSPIDDIRLTSSGMKEVIDLAHRIIVMKFLHLDDYPLYLDEFGSKFDPVHKQKAHSVIKTLTEDFKQIFIISHEQDMFTVYDSDLSILSTDNLYMSEIEEYNEVLKIS